MAAAVILAGCLLPPPARAYSVMTHEEVVDLAWQQHMVPLLRARYPGITDAQIKEAHAFAYGGCIIQDLGYYPMGSKFFSDLTHYVRTGDFVQALLTGATTPDELAFALGALAHYTSDEIGHPYVNQVTAQEFPRMQKKFGRVVTYEDGPSHHLRTEFGFDVVGVARGKYGQEDYRNFIGFQVAKPLLERAFEETYGIKLKDVIRNEDLSINSCRWAVSTLIPKMTKVALLTYHDQIEHATPGFDRNKFVYRMSRTEYEKNWSGTYKKPGFGSHLLAGLITILPKVGPLKALKLKLPDGDQQALYLKSVNETVDRLNGRLARMRVAASPVPVPVVAQSNGKSADEGTVKPADKDTLKTASATGEAADAGTPLQTSTPLSAPPKTSVAQPMGDVPLVLTSVDLDTGKNTAPGEYALADKTYGKLLEKVADLPPAQISPLLKKDLLLYFGSGQAGKNSVAREAKDWAKIQAALARVQAVQPAQAATVGD